MCVCVFLQVFTYKDDRKEKEKEIFQIHLHLLKLLTTELQVGKKKKKKNTALPAGKGALRGDASFHQLSDF